MVKKLKLNNALKLIKSRVRNLIKKKKVVIVGIAGGSGSGKGYVAKKLGWKTLHMDDYYFGEDKNRANNYDTPDSIEIELLEKHLKDLKRGRTILKPVYDFSKRRRIGWERFDPSKVIIVEGLFVLRKPIRNLLDVKVFVDAPVGIRLKRRVKRDLEENRHGTAESTIKMFLEQAEPNYKKYITRTRRGAIIIDNSVDI